MTSKLDNSQVMNLVFQNELTEQGLAELREKYPEDLVVDMSDEKQFKEARKTRTERNKLNESIDRRRKDVTAEIKQKGDGLIERVTEIYSVVVDPFEAEDKRRKEEAARIKAEREKALAVEREQIAEMTGFVSQCQGKDSAYIADAIEAVDLIETDVFDKELIHEAIETKKDVLAQLTQMHADAKAREKVDQEREQLQREQALQERINKLQMDPTNYFGKSAEEIEARINSLSNYTPTEQEFGEKAALAEQIKTQVVQQLTIMLDQAKQLERTSKAPEQSEAPKGKEPLLQTTSIPALEDDEAPYEHADWPTSRSDAPSNKSGYTPLDLWPSDMERMENDELNRVCIQLEEAEAFIDQLLKAQRKAA